MRGALVTAGLALALSAPALAVADATGGAPQAPSEQRTSPRVSPRSGPPTARFTVRFTLRSDAGHEGVLQTAYRVVVDRPRGAKARDPAPAPAPVAEGAAGSRARVVLRRPRGGWCVGRYRVSVLLERGPYCPPPSDAGAPTPCPAFASQDLNTGSATFTVRRPRAR